MEDAFAIVLFGVVAVAVVVGIIAAAGSGSAWEQIGKGGLSLRDGTDRPASEPVSGGAAYEREREDEVRQMLEARNERRVRRGEAPVDVDVEMAALLAPSADPGLEAEVRDMVIASNERRERRGKAPLDVEAEVQRRLRELG